MTQDLFVVGTSHHVAPLDIREKLAVPPSRMNEELASVSKLAGCEELIVVSTCNRVEYYGIASDPSHAAELIKGKLQASLGKADASVLYHHWGTNAVRHLFRVSASLDSMVVGEPQILGQVKEAFRLAEQAKQVGSILHRSFTRSFTVAKRIRTETKIASGSVSISSVACELANKIFGRLEGRKTLLLGAGEMGEAAAKALSGTGTILRVLNRSPDKAERIAQQCGGESRPYDTLPDELASAEVVIVSTGSSDFVITKPLMKKVLRARRRRPIFLIDIAVPRNVDPSVGKMENVFLYDVDDLQQVAAINLAARRGAIDEAETAIEAEVQSFDEWRRAQRVKPTILALRNHIEEIIQSEIDRTEARMSNLPEEDRQRLRAMGKAIMNKLLHGPVQELKQAALDDESTGVVNIARRLFHLEGSTLTPGDQPGESSESSDANANKERETA